MAYSMVVDSGCRQSGLCAVLTNADVIGVTLDLRRGMTVISRVSRCRRPFFFSSTPPPPHGAEPQPATTDIFKALAYCCLPQIHGNDLSFFSFMFRCGWLHHKPNPNVELGWPQWSKMLESPWSLSWILPWCQSQGTQSPGEIRWTPRGKGNAFAWPAVTLTKSQKGHWMFSATYWVNNTTKRSILYVFLRV